LPRFEQDSWVLIAPAGQTAQVYYCASHNPAEPDPAKADTATIKVELVREAAQAGCPEYWRIARVQFLGRQFKAPTLPQIVRAYGITLDESATPAQVASVALRTLGDLVAAQQQGNRDKQASARYRLYALSDPAGVQARAGQADKPAAGEMEDTVTAGLNAAVSRWARQVQPVAGQLAGDAVAPDQLQTASENQVVYRPAGGQGAITLNFVRASFAGKSFCASRCDGQRARHRPPGRVGVAQSQLNPQPR